MPTNDESNGTYVQHLIRLQKLNTRFTILIISDLGSLLMTLFDYVEYCSSKNTLFDYSQSVIWRLVTTYWNYVKDIKKTKRVSYLILFQNYFS